MLRAAGARYAALQTRCTELVSGGLVFMMRRLQVRRAAGARCAALQTRCTEQVRDHGGQCAALQTWRDAQFFFSSRGVGARIGFCAEQVRGLFAGAGGAMLLTKR